MMARTKESHTWTPEGGLKSGNFLCKGVISPPQHVKSSEDTVYDVLVVGGGYAGLAAVRDLTSAGRSVLLIEGRDRIGGRTYTIEDDGFNFEMGGTWIYHTQPYTFRELMRYKMDRDLIVTRDARHENNYFTINVPGSKRNTSHEDGGKLAAKAWKLFVDVDGAEGRTICPLPHSQLGNIKVDRKVVERWDSLSCWDRYLQIKDQLTQEERGVLMALLLGITGSKPDLKNSGFWDMIRSHSLNGHSWDQMDEIWLSYKLRDGQSTLARKMFDEAVGAGLEYTFKTHVDRITQTDGGTGFVQIHTRDGRVFEGRKAVCTNLPSICSLKVSKLPA